MPALAAAALVFTSSALVLVLEILAGRLLAPYLGVTLETFTGIIGTILAGIALGSFVGGRLADRRDPRTLIGPLLIVGGLLSAMSIPIVDTIGSSGLRSTPMTIVIVAAAGFFFPAAVLSAVSPAVVKMQLQSLEETGSVVGRLSAVGTAGALVGTFVTGFLLVAAAPTRPIIRGVALALIVLGIAMTVWLRGRAAIDQSMVIVAIAGLGMSFVTVGPCQYESAYFCATVLVDAENPSGRLLVLDTLRHSYVDLDDPTHLEFTYAQTLSDVLAAIGPSGEALDVLHIGGGGFSVPRYLEATRPGTNSLVLELDPTLVRIAEQELGLVTGPLLRVTTGDARLNIRDVEDGTQDLVIGDAFGGVSVPWHLTTREFVTEIKDTLRPGGVYAINLIDYRPLGFARAEAATMLDVFANVAVLGPPDRLDQTTRGGNFVMIASDGPLPIGQILARNSRRGDDEAAITGEALQVWLQDAQVLRDDFAPVDQLLTPLPPRA